MRQTKMKNLLKILKIIFILTNVLVFLSGVCLTALSVWILVDSDSLIFRPTFVIFRLIDLVKKIIDENATEMEKLTEIGRQVAPNFWDYFCIRNFRFFFIEKCLILNNFRNTKCIHKKFVTRNFSTPNFFRRIFLTRNF